MQNGQSKSSFNCTLSVCFKFEYFYVFSVCKLKRLLFGPAEMFRNHSYFNTVLRSLYRFVQVIHIH